MKIIQMKRKTTQLISKTFSYYLTQFTTKNISPLLQQIEPFFI